MNYKKHYNKLIKRGKSRLLEEYTESHHIIPRCMGGKDTNDNLVDLTPEEHYVAHQLLVKIHPNNTKLLYAAQFMVANRVTNRSYGWIRRRLSDNMKKNNPNAAGKCNKLRKGKYNRSDQAKENISNGLKANKVNIGTKNSNFGIKPWHHPRATSKTKAMWANANTYYEWWISSGLEHGQNAMAREFNEKFCGTHNNLVKYFRNKWIPSDDNEWVKFKEIYYEY